MHAAGAGMRRREIGPHRDVQLGGRAALAHLIDVHAVAVRFRMRIVAHLLHVHDLREHQIGRPQLRHRHGDRPEPADLMLGRHRALVPRMRLALAAVIDQRQALAFRVLEIERRPAVALGDIADASRRLLAAAHATTAALVSPCNAHAGAGDGVVAALLAAPSENRKR